MCIETVLHSWAKIDTHTHITTWANPHALASWCGDTAEEGREGWPIIHHPAPWTSGAEYNLSEGTVWYNHHSARVSVSPGSLSNWLISSLSTVWLYIIHVVEGWGRKAVCPCVCMCVWRGLSQVARGLMRGWCRMDNGEDGLFTKISGKWWVDLLHPPPDTIVCKSLTVV